MTEQLSKELMDQIDVLTEEFVDKNFCEVVYDIRDHFRDFADEVARKSIQQHRADLWNALLLAQKV